MGADLDLYGRRRNGSEFPVEIALSPVSTEKGSFVLSAIRDITDRKRIAEELRRANEELYRKTVEQIGEYRSRLASIIDSSEDAILSKNLDGTITSWNRGAERMYGYALEKSSGSTSPFLLRPIVRTKSRRSCKKLLPEKASSIVSQYASPKMVGT